jgi:hypothetical protein
VRIDAHGPLWVEVASENKPRTHKYTLHEYREQHNKLDVDYCAPGAMLVDLLHEFAPTRHGMLPDTMPDLMPIRGKSPGALLMSAYGVRSLDLTVATLSSQDLRWIVGRDIYVVDFTRRVSGNADAISGIERGTLHYLGDDPHEAGLEFRSPVTLDLESYYPATLSDIKIDEGGGIESGLSGTWTVLGESAPGVGTRDLRWTYWDVFLHQQVAVRLLGALAWLFTTGFVIASNVRALIKRPAN